MSFSSFLVRYLCLYHSFYFSDRVKCGRSRRPEKTIRMLRTFAYFVSFVCFFFGDCFFLFFFAFLMSHTLARARFFCPSWFYIILSMFIVLLIRPTTWTRTQMKICFSLLFSLYSKITANIHCQFNTCAHTESNHCLYSILRWHTAKQK